MRLSELSCQATTNDATISPTAESIPVPVSIITTCYGRNRHLYNLLASLASGSAKPAEVVIVNDDADPDKLASFDLNIVQIATVKSDTSVSEPASDNAKIGFDIGRNRNRGAEQATFERLIFLDVDCIVCYDFVKNMAAKLTQHSDALIMGQPRYLSRPLAADEEAKLNDLLSATEMLVALSVLNPYRYNLPESGSLLKPTQDYGAFWSLCFAITHSQFVTIGGFDTHYVGYGAEDTDFAFMAQALDVPFYLSNDVVFHQQHGVYRPPLNHLPSIIINANRFYDKWQHWPMGGWLEAFAERALIDWEAGQDNPIIITRLPTEQELAEAHYPDAPYV